MSGIFGSFHRCPEEKGLSGYLRGLDRWNKAYGSDGSDVYTTDRWGIGAHIEHLSQAYPAGSPILRRNAETAVVDAIIYNRDELLEALGPAVSETISDEELLLLWIREKGYDALAQVNGDFAGAIFDETSRTWTLFRDHMGVRPLFYYLDERLFAFSTDIRGLVALPGADMKINENKLYLRMMGYNDLSLCETELQYIRCVRPASRMTVKETTQGFQLDEAVYWRLRQKKIRLRSDEAYQKELRRLITDAVKRRLDAVPGLVGGELSGGLDSGVVDILISRLGREGRFFSWSFRPEELPLQDIDERRVILDICRQEGISCTFCRKADRRPLEELFEKGYPPYVNTTVISATSAILRDQGVRAIFTGHGGDEGVSHRCNLLELWQHKEYGAFFRIIWDSTKGKKLRLLRTAKRSWRQVTKEHAFFRKPYHNKTHNAAPMLAQAFCDRMAPGAELQPLYFAYRPADFVEQGGSRNRLDNLAIQSAHNGVRYMIPFLDYRVIDFAVSIPRRLYVKNGINRCIYREAFRDIMPESLYQMSYKDTASQRNYTLEENLREEVLTAWNKMAARLDREFWKEYLDFDKIDKFTLPENFDVGAYVAVTFLFDDLNQCCLLQNMIEQAGRW